MAFKILSLDGGGSWALIQARVLERKYGPEKTGHELINEYDMVAANSGGSLVLAMLLANKKLKDIIATFNNPKILQAIFKKTVIAKFFFLKPFLPNYDSEEKYQVFRKHSQTENRSFGDELLSDLPRLVGKEKLQIIITGFDYDRQRAIYFRSNKNSKMESAWIESVTNPNYITDTFKYVTLAQAVHASSNAPIQFFNHPASFQMTVLNNENQKCSTEKRRLFWDGAVGGNNNPIRAAVLEAMANGAPREKIQIISIGTSSTIRPIIYGEQGEAKPDPDWKFLCKNSKVDCYLPDLKKMATSILDDPPDAATFDVHQILGLDYIQNDPRLIRFNPLIKPRLKDGKWIRPGKPEIWSKEEMKILFELDMAVSNKSGIKLINKFCDDYFTDYFDNQGIRIGGQRVDAILGHKLSSQAFEDWNNSIWK